MELPKIERLIFLTLLQVIQLGMKNDVLGFFFKVSFQALGFLHLISDVPATQKEIL